MAFDTEVSLGQVVFTGVLKGSGDSRDQVTAGIK